MNSIPKSLHTVSSLVALARYLIQRDGLTEVAAVAVASDILGYGHSAADPYGLTLVALRKLQRGA